jgi:hypothetical protein
MPLDSSQAASSQSFAALRTSWSERHAAFVESYKAATTRSSAHASKLEELSALEERSGALRRSVDVQRQELYSLGDPLARHLELRKQWRDLQSEQTQLIEQQCGRLTELSDELIRASVSGGAGTDRFAEELRSAVRGSTSWSTATQSSLSAATTGPLVITRRAASSY